MTPLIGRGRGQPGERVVKMSIPPVFSRTPTSSDTPQTIRIALQGMRFTAAVLVAGAREDQQDGRGEGRQPDVRRR